MHNPSSLDANFIPISCQVVSSRTWLEIANYVSFILAFINSTFALSIVYSCLHTVDPLP